MASSNPDARLQQALRDALAGGEMPSAARERLRERLLARAAAEAGRRGGPSGRAHTRRRRRAGIGPNSPWQWAVAAALVFALAGASSFGTFRWLGDRAVARAWEERVLARTEELLKHPELWRHDPDTLAQRVGAGHAQIVHPRALTPVGSSRKLHVPLGPNEVLVIEPGDDVQRLASGMRHVFWLSTAAGLAPLLAGGGWLWWRWRRQQQLTDEADAGSENGRDSSGDV